MGDDLGVRVAGLANRREENRLNAERLDRDARFEPNRSVRQLLDQFPWRILRHYSGPKPAVAEPGRGPATSQCALAHHSVLPPEGSLPVVKADPPCPHVSGR